MGYRKERKSEREPDPILKLRNARLFAEKVIERDADEKDGTKFAPSVSILWKILDDGKKGEYNDVKFWDRYSFVKSFEFEENGEYVIREDTRIGDLVAFLAYEYHDGADFFDDDVEVDFEDLEGAEITAQLEPRQFKNDPPTGTRTKSSTLQLAEKADKVAANVPASEDDEGADIDESDFSDIPF